MFDRSADPGLTDCPEPCHRKLPRVPWGPCAQVTLVAFLSHPTPGKSCKRHAGPQTPNTLPGGQELRQVAPREMSFGKPFFFFSFLNEI